MTPRPEYPSTLNSANPSGILLIGGSLIIGILITDGLSPGVGDF